MSAPRANTAADVAAYASVMSEIDFYRLDLAENRDAPLWGQAFVTAIFLCLFNWLAKGCEGARVRLSKRDQDHGAARADQRFAESGDEGQRSEACGCSSP